MNLNDVSAKLSTDGLPKIRLVHLKTQKVIRELDLVKAKPEHRSFILTTWMNSYRPPPEMKKLFNSWEPAIAESYWGDCTVLTDEDGYTIYGWACFDFDTLGLIHCYVIPELRKLRVMTRMLEYVSKGNSYWYARKWPYGAHARVNPYLLRVKPSNARSEDFRDEVRDEYADH